MGSFARNHPKFVNFIGALKNNYIKEGTIIEISVSKEDGKQITSNLKLTERILSYLQKPNYLSLKNLIVQNLYISGIYLMITIIIYY